MSGALKVVNRQRFRRVDAAFLKAVAVHLLEVLLRRRDYDLAIHLLSSREMAALNRKALGHEGATDVITFDYSGEPPLNLLAGELFICVEVAAEQAVLFKTDWRQELARYAAHGVLHLLGHDDLRPQARRKMKAAENRLVNRLGKEFDLSKLGPKPKLCR